jgi:hypothetical protein
MTRTTKLFAAAALGVFLASACQNDQLFRPANFVPIDPLFARYVSMGNSITAGFQSGGINDSTQIQAYPVLLASRMGSPFFPPLMNRPGCPAPFTNVFTQTRVAGGPTTCALRARQQVPSAYISNTAVPGAEVLDIYNNLDAASNANALTTFFLGGMTQAQMMQRAKPTFVTVWIGNNDVLGAATNSANAGDSTLITPVALFETRYSGMLDSIADVAPQGVVLIGVASVVRIANRVGLPPTQPPANGVPFFAYGSTYYALDQAAQIPGPFVADPTCAPPRGDSVLVPFPLGGALIAGGGTLTCNEVQTVQPAEAVKLATTVAAYNAYIAAQAAARGWTYFDPNPTLDSLRRIPTQVAFFPNFGSPAPTACSASPFGLAFSCDAVHPSAATHKLIANQLRQAINAAFGTAIPTIF